MKEKLVKALLEMWGFKVTDYGHMTGSTEYTPEISRDIGRPDYKVEGSRIRPFYVEVTGTFTMPDTYWIRPDKIRWAAKHSDELSYLAFVASDTGEIQFIPFKRVIPFIDHTIPYKTEIMTEIPAPISSKRFREWVLKIPIVKESLGDFA